MLRVLKYTSVYDEMVNNLISSSHILSNITFAQSGEVVVGACDFSSHVMREIKLQLIVLSW